MEEAHVWLKKNCEATAKMEWSFILSLVYPDQTHLINEWLTVLGASSYPCSQFSDKHDMNTNTRGISSADKSMTSDLAGVMNCTSNHPCQTDYYAIRRYKPKSEKKGNVSVTGMVAAGLEVEQQVPSNQSENDFEYVANERNMSEVRLLVALLFVVDTWKDISWNILNMRYILTKNPRTVLLNRTIRLVKVL